MAKLNIVLLEPEIPANTGNIGRTCVATDTKLHLIEPLGFSLSEKALKRAGMDYWKDLDVTTYLDYEDFLEKNPNAKIYYATTKALKTYKIDRSRGKDQKGTGLGLAIVKEILHAHGQHINVISTEGVGTEFIFTLEKAK